MSRAGRGVRLSAGVGTRASSGPHGVRATGAGAGGGAAAAACLMPPSITGSAAARGMSRQPSQRLPVTVPETPSGAGSGVPQQPPAAASRATFPSASMQSTHGPPGVAAARCRRRSRQGPAPSAGRGRFMAASGMLRPQETRGQAPRGHFPSDSPPGEEASCTTRPPTTVASTCVSGIRHTLQVRGSRSQITRSAWNPGRSRPRRRSAKMP